MSFVRGLRVYVDLFVCVCETWAQANLIIVFWLWLNSIRFQHFSLPFSSYCFAHWLHVRFLLSCLLWTIHTKRKRVQSDSELSIAVTVLRVKIRRRCVKTLLLLFQPLSDWRAAFDAGRCSCCIIATVRFRVAAVFTSHYSNIEDRLNNTNKLVWRCTRCQKWRFCHFKAVMLTFS